MEHTHFRQGTLVLLMFFALAALVLAVEGEGKRKKDEQKKMMRKKAVYALIPVYIGVAILPLIFITWALWRTCHNWGWWRIHAPSPCPQYSRTLFGWVDRETLESKQAKRARRKKTKRDQRKIYRTTKADYRWVFHDPTGELQQRYDNQKKRSHLRLLPSWMRSYPHGTLQSNRITKPGKASKGIYQPPKSQSSFQGCLTTLNSLELAQFDGSSFSDPLYNPCNESDLSIMTFIDAITPVAVDKQWLRSRMRAAHQPDTIQVWHVRERALPALMGMPEFETEQEMEGGVEQHQTVVETLDGEVEQQGPSVGGDTEQRPVEREPPRTVITMNITRVSRDGTGRSPGHPLEMSIPHVLDTSGPDARQRFFEGLDARFRELRREPSLVLVYYSMDILLQLYHQAIWASHRQAPIVSRPPVRASSVPANVPENVPYAGRLRCYIRLLYEQIENFQGQIQDPNLIHVGRRAEVSRRIENVRHQLRAGRAALERLGPIASSRSVDELRPTPNTAMILEPTPTPVQIRLMGFERMPILNGNTFNRNTAMGPEPRQIATPGMRPTNMAVRAPVTLNGVHGFHQMVMQYLDRRFGAFLGGSVAQDVEAFDRDITALRRILQCVDMVRDDLATASWRSAQPTQRMRIYLQTVNSSTPTIATPQIHRQAHHAIIESLAAGDDDSAIAFARVGVHDGSIGFINEGSTTQVNSSPYSIAEENVQPLTQRHNAAEGESSVPDHDSLVGQVDSAAQPSPEPEDLVHAEATRQTAASDSETHRSEDSPAAHNQEADNEEDASLTTSLGDLSSSAAAQPSPEPEDLVHAEATRQTAVSDSETHRSEDSPAADNQEAHDEENASLTTSLGGLSLSAATPSTQPATATPVIDCDAKFRSSGGCYQ